MYSSHSHLNILTALLLAHGIEEAVVCPGSRNAAIVHNLHEAGLHLHPVTDERSAAFVAIGIALRVRRPVVVCVTSGSALLNTLPAVAEAALRHIPLIVLSADRPPQWIDQLDGQTLPQVGALQPYARTWHLPQPHDEEERWWVERLVNEALLATAHEGGSVVHLNVPLREPLFDYTEAQLPKVRAVCEYRTEGQRAIPTNLLAEIEASRLLVVYVGERTEALPVEWLHLQATGKALLYAECLSQADDTTVAHALDADDVRPDMVLHVGGASVSKHFKLFLRRCADCKVVRIDEEAQLHDTFMHLSAHLIAPLQAVARQLDEMLSPKLAVQNFLALHKFSAPTPLPQDLEAIFVGNSSMVRWANRHFAQCTLPIFGNRGTNGIEGSLSVAAGYSLVSQHKVLCLLGDLSFFYDANALWNERLDGRLRILMVNNAGGAIFDHIAGIGQSPAYAACIKAEHRATAVGIAQSYGCTYRALHVERFADEATALIDQLLAVESQRPVIFEVFIPNSLL
ncbi:MAG: 2-succinyl-5-enolpyruvyl-6-hydroxy-3-cyclohexene-1-carboxylic-acid synthase [Bacteroidales bacterium]|nr:2-succinyl-5-enolpyruvyl-6-hydroxy-3-cyclohexene-1-carboxylic-acid synthase [Bacteroidales bacterium]